MKTRVSCSAFARIQDARGRVALHLGTKEGRIIMRPLGGAFRTNGSGRQYLISTFGASGFEDEHDLRFVAPIAEINDLYDWFCTRKMRETSVLHMLRTQLRGLHVVGRHDVVQMEETLAIRTTRTGVTDRQGVRIRRTQYLIEVFDVKLSPETLQLLEQASTGGNRPLHFATPDEIRAQSGPGGNISSLANTLVRRGT